MENKITPEMIEQAKKAASVEELLALAKENKIILTAERAQKLFDQWHENRELSDDELDSVAGGCGGGGSLDYCPGCGGPLSLDPCRPGCSNKSCSMYGRYPT